MSLRTKPILVPLVKKISLNHYFGGINMNYGNSCPEDVLLLESLDDYESKSLPKDYKMFEEPSSQSSSLMDYMKTYMSDNSDEDEDETEIYKMDNDDLNEISYNNINECLTKEQIENFDGTFKYGCPVTKKICENVALALLKQQNDK